MKKFSFGLILSLFICISISAQEIDIALNTVGKILKAGEKAVGKRVEVKALKYKSNDKTYVWFVDLRTKANITTKNGVDKFKALKRKKGRFKAVLDLYKIDTVKKKIFGILVSIK